MPITGLRIYTYLSSSNSNVQPGVFFWESEVVANDSLPPEFSLHRVEFTFFSLSLFVFSLLDSVPLHFNKCYRKLVHENLLTCIA